MHFLVLEYVPGGSLSDRPAGEQPLTVLEATQALIDGCKGVGAAHAAGLINRDIKPANFMRAADGSVKVADFGLAKAVAGAGRHFTLTGMVVGMCNSRCHQPGHAVSLEAPGWTAAVTPR
jgi:serine/threonine protein kinase